VQRRQVELAKLYGVGGFCFYFYWFNGRRPLEKPLENYLNDKALDLPFCLCWANENWTRRWDGRDWDILLAQHHSAEDDLAFIAHISKYLRDPRYIRIDGRPLVLLYRPGLLPAAKETVRRWREWCRNNGIGELYLAYSQSYEQLDPDAYDFDAAIEFPTGVEPDNSALPRVKRGIKLLNKGFAGHILDWSDYARRSRNYANPAYKLFRGVCPSWDNTPRRKDTARILVNNSPAGYHEWLLNAIADTCLRFPDHDERLVFVNAWNEWAEGAYLEPDARNGYAYLEATRLALAGAAYVPLSREGVTWITAYLPGRLRVAKEEPVVLLCAHYSGPYVFGGERSFLDILDGLQAMGANVICTVPSTRNEAYINAVRDRSAGVYILPYRQWSPSSEDEPIIEKFVEIIRRHSVDIIYVNTIMLREPVTAAQRCGAITVTHAREIITADEHLAGEIGLPPDEIVKQVVSRSDYIIANSRTTAECYAGHKPVMVVPNTVDIDQLELENNVDAANIRFALVSNNLPKKGLNDLIQLAKRCESSLPNARFLIIGPDNRHVDALKLDQKDGKVPANVEFPGYRNTPREAMTETNVVLILSHFKESFGRTAIEAMAARRPVIAYNWGAPAELVRDGETGFLVDFQNMDQLADRVKRLCENPGLISEMGLRGHAFASSQYSKDRFVERFRDAYSKILDEIRSRRKVCDFKLLRAAPPTAVIVPVYNAYEELRECIASVQEHTNLEKNRVIVIEDGSSDVRVREFLEALKNVEVVYNEQNMGYTKTCNKGISMAAPSDIVLLNSDTIVTPRWLESLRVAAYSSTEVGTATALSDNAGAFSVPVPNEQNTKPEGVDYSDYARLMRRFCGGCAPPRLPTGNGFCMFIKRTLINQIGDFDAAAFPRGYGEENDFCLRAVKAGWRNVIAPAAFVFHRRKASFGAEKEQLLADGMKVIKKRYPDYTQLANYAFSCSAMKTLQRAARRASIAAATPPAETRVAVLTHASGLSNLERDGAMRRMSVFVDRGRLSFPSIDAVADKHNASTRVTQDLEQEFAAWLLRNGIDRVDIETPNDLPFDVREVCDLLGVPCSVGGREKGR
jgi:glycosyltransferase involved in cell wall biosynthesis/GT2 family glycosyltransferase